MLKPLITNRHVVLGLIMVIVIMCIWHISTGTFSPTSQKPWKQSKSPELSKIKHSSQSEAAGHDEGKAKRKIQSKELEELKKRWLSIVPTAQSGKITEECQQLALESVRRLMCSHEAIELIAFLEANNLNNGLAVFKNEMIHLLRSPDAIRARESLMQLDGDPTAPESSVRYCVEWSYAAGQGFTDEDLERFCSVMKDRDCVVSAQMGRNLVIADTDPIRAITSTLKILASGESSGFSWLGMRDQVAKLPLSSDFAAVEKLFPLEDPNDKELNSPVDVGRETLFERWAVTDPAAAANYVMEYPDRFKPEMIGLIAGTVTKANPLVGLEWVRKFPAGPYFDAAAASAIAYLHDGHPDEALKLASEIGDPKLRQKNTDFIHLSQQPGAHGR